MVGVILLLFIICYCHATITKNQVEVNIDFTPFPKRTMEFSVEGEHLKQYHFTLPLNESLQMTQFTCIENDKELQFEVIAKPENETIEVIVDLLDQQKNKFTCKYLHIDALENYPKERSLSEKYKFLFTTHLCPLSDHIKCTTLFNLKSIQSIAFSIKPTTEGSSRLKFGPYEPTEFKFISYHLQSSLHPMTYGRVQKVVNINEDNIYVHMEIDDMKNNGAILNKEFNRNDFNYEGIYLKDFSMEVEVNAYNLEYRDSTGLITTGHLVSRPKSSTLYLPPRYPLLGGWKTSFEVNYNYPLDVSVQQIKEQKRLVIPLKVDFKGIVSNEEVDIVLPEGATITSINYPKRSYIKETVYNQPSFGTYYKKPVVQLILKEVDMSDNTDMLEIYYKENPAAKRTKNIIVAFLTSSIIIIFLLYAKVINN
ncbi:hypothetical protein ENUP19_0009G0004 [Entamoeba nuttalli]|uniref:Dolichyl-diphosphooligosaccharide--protein glycosyltransferase subunit 1 n=1 Tax=Entamoeba nuttalli TaxID=412467 RepID=A0ABQ0D7S9_9EUKA